MSGHPGFESFPAQHCYKLPSELTQEEFEKMKEEADEVVKQYEQQQKEKDHGKRKAK